MEEISAQRGAHPSRMDSEGRQTGTRQRISSTEQETMASTRVTSLAWRWLAVVLVAGLAADAAWGFFPSLPPTNRVGPGGGGGGGPTPPSNQTPPGSPPPPSPPSSPPGVPSSPPPGSPPGAQVPPAPPFIPPSTGVTPTPPTAIPEINVHGLAAGLGITLCGLLMLTDRKRRHKGVRSTTGR